jgi:hypothetical protein
MKKPKFLLKKLSNSIVLVETKDNFIRATYNPKRDYMWGETSYFEIFHKLLEKEKKKRNGLLKKAEVWELK